MPEGVEVDAHGNVYVGDMQNNRVLEFDNPLIGDVTADTVLWLNQFHRKQTKRRWHRHGQYIVLSCGHHA